MKARQVDSDSETTHENENERRTTDWATVAISSAICFFSSVQFSIYFSSLWPYLLELDNDATERFFGYITAMYSLGQAIASPAFGWWSSRIGQTRLVTQFGLILMTVGNILYMSLPLGLMDVKYMMLLARFIMGMGGGIIGILRSAAITGSTQVDRSRVISVNTGAFSLGLSTGPAIQLLFTPIGYPGITILGPIKINIYTLPAITSNIVNIISLILVAKYYKDSDVGIHQIKEKLEKEEHKRFYALPKFDRLAALICIFTRFAQMFLLTNLETIGSPLTMTMFAWDRKTAVFWNSVIHGGSSAIAFLIYSSNTILNYGKRMNHRIWCIVGLSCIALFHLLTYPWPFIDTKITYQEEEYLLNGTEPVGCRRSFDWCSYVPAINVYLYGISYAVLSGIAFALITITMNTVYSTVIGPRNQGMMQGMLVFIGSCARLSGPIVIAELFTLFGPGVPWIIEIAVSISCAALWIVFYRRLVPLKMDNTLSAGDVYRNKYGHVYKF